MYGALESWEEGEMLAKVSKETTNPLMNSSRLLGFPDNPSHSSSTLELLPMNMVKEILRNCIQ